MSKKKATLAPFEQTAYQRAELAAFRRMLTLSEGTFSLSIAICNSSALRDHILAHITQEFKGIQAVHIDRNTLDIFDSVRQRIDNQTPEAIFVTNIDQALNEENRDRVIQGLNSSRESWKSRYHCPVVFWLPEYASVLLATQARDLWSWISHTFEFVSEQASPMEGTRDIYAGNTLMAGNLDVHEKHFRIAELEQRIAGIGDSPSGTLIEHALVWLNELAYLHQTIGDLEQAEKMHSHILEINQKLGRLEGVANQYGNLGLIYQTRSDLDQAETMIKQALEIQEKLGKPEDVANSYNNLGAINIQRGSFTKAEEMCKRALRIDQELGRLTGMASEYGNLGLIYQIQGDLDKAEAMHNKSLQIEEDLGHLSGVASQYGNLGRVHQGRGDIAKAWKMHNKALEIHRELGEIEGVARDYVNLGDVYKSAGNLVEMRTSWEKALALFQQVGMSTEVAMVQSWLDRLPKE